MRHPVFVAMCHPLFRGTLIPCLEGDPPVEYHHKARVNMCVRSLIQGPTRSSVSEDHPPMHDCQQRS